MRPLFRFLCCFSCCLLFAACSGGPRLQGTGNRHPAASTPDALLCADLTAIPQDLTPFAQQAGPDRVLLPASEQAEQVRALRRAFFQPWEKSGPSRWVGESLAKNFNMRPDKAYRENLRPFSDKAWQDLVANSNAPGFPSTAQRAITVRNTGLRAMPTARPFFLNPDAAGEGFPFDYFQHTALWTGTPLFISHISADRQWALAESSLTAGWVPLADIAVVDAAFVRTWQDMPLAALVKDGVTLTALDAKSDGGAQIHTSLAHIGTLLPMAGSTERGPVVLFPGRGEDGRAVMRRAALDRDQAAALPLPLTPAAIARIGNEMMGQPYGWGGLFEDRDCSALTRDIFVPFGLWLPRNSASQASWGTQVELTGLSPEEKETRIAGQAVPFFTLIWLKGHIGLYVGEHAGRPAMFHNLWGLRVLTRGEDGAPNTARAVIGKAVVTSLRPGAELPGISSPNSLLDRIERATLLPRPPANNAGRASAPDI